LANALVRFKPATTNKIKLAPKIQLKIHLLSYFVRVILLFKQASKKYTVYRYLRNAEQITKMNST
jgi:exopolysaccharide biosynthesis protein